MFYNVGLVAVFIVQVTVIITVNCLHFTSSTQALNKTDLQVDEWEILAVKGVMKGQKLRLRKLVNPYNSLNSCYKVSCLGNGCPNQKEKATINFCYPGIIVTGLPKCATTAMYDLLALYPYAIKNEFKENCPFSHRRPHWQFFNSLPRMSSVNTNKSLIIDGCLDLNANLIIRKYLRYPQTLYIVSFIGMTSSLMIYRMIFAVNDEKLC